MERSSSVSRRRFLRLSALAAGAAGLSSTTSASVPAPASVALVVSPDDAVAMSPATARALDTLQTALKARGVAAVRVDAASRAPASALRVIVCGARSATADRLVRGTGVGLPDDPEGLVILPLARSGGRDLVVCSPGSRGLMYGVLDLADRVESARDALAELGAVQPSDERPFTQVRAVGRPFVSDVEDTPWFRDRTFWPEYFGMLARHRFNRFHFSLGFGFDTLRWVKDAYLLFAYPFLLDVPGYKVRAVPLPDAERDGNMEMLRFISDEAAAHGIDFQLGLWTHWHIWADSADTNYTIEGLTADTLAPYSRDALAAILKACPSITGVALRTHYESGVREGSYAFWKTIFDAFPRSGRRVEVELHAKGLDQQMIDNALATGMPVRVSPKYWAEHTGLPYQQTAIRELELPHADTSEDGFSVLSTGMRNHTRYGYADFMAEARPYRVMFRVFPGSHKFLLWGDPVTAAAHARAFAFCGADGAELLEPLAFKGRRGSGVPGGRCGYREAALAPARDWQKFAYTYRVWGRSLYSPATDPAVWQRGLRREFGDAAPAMGSALGTATRIFPLVTTAHLPSAAQDTYCPEFYTNHSLVEPSAAGRYGDTPEPRVFGRVSPLDPEVFSTIDDYARALLAGTPGARYSPVDVAAWLDELSAATETSLGQARLAAGRAPSTATHRASIDVAMQAGIGRFFAAKLRAGVLFAIHEQSGDREALVQAISAYRAARHAWSGVAAEASAVYVSDITFGVLPDQRGHWADRVAAIDADIARLERRLAGVAPQVSRPAGAAAAVRAALARPSRPDVTGRHTAPSAFVRGEAVPVAFHAPADRVSAATLHYRHVNQAERYVAVPMEAAAGVFQAEIPGRYTDSPYPLQFYITWTRGSEAAGLYPPLGPDLTNQPYVVIRQRSRG